MKQKFSGSGPSRISKSTDCRAWMVDPWRFIFRDDGTGELVRILKRPASGLAMFFISARWKVICKVPDGPLTDIIRIRSSIR